MWTANTVYQIQPLPKKTEGQKPSLDFLPNTFIYLYSTKLSL